MHKAIVYIGRFEPFHNAHLATIKQALSLGEQLIVVIGSANQPRDEQNPFTAFERQDMIMESLQAEDVDLSRVKFMHVENTIYNNAEWAMSVERGVKAIESSNDIKLIGHDKDESSFYLKMFKQWGEPIEVPMVEILDATTIRNLYFSPKFNINFMTNVVPGPVKSFLTQFATTDAYQDICRNAEYHRDYQKQFEHLPYAPTFLTGDTVVVKGMFVLMIQRGKYPGKGLWAFPGGFMNAKSRTTRTGKFIKADTSLVDTAIRELYEETRIDLPEKMIRGCIKEEKRFDAVNRSLRGRVVTTTQLVVLPDDGLPLPKVRAADDAAHAEFRLITDVKRDETFEDHYDQLQYFRGRMSAYQK